MEAGVPEYVFSMFQGKFAIITPALIAGAFAERVTFKGYVVFIALWGLLVYNPLCHWVWAEDGFLFNLGANGAITWIIIEGFHQGKATALGFASGILAGLVAVTPAAGVVQPYGAMILGIIASSLCYMGILIKNRVGYDDSLDAFGIHGIGGIAGAIFLSFFIRHSWMEEAAQAAGGTWNVLQQLGVQVSAVLVAIFYAAIGTLVILVVVQKLVGLRSSNAEEMQGLDFSIHGEHGYGMVNAG